MDPNAAYAEMIELAKKVRVEAENYTDVSARDADRLAELIQALDEWLSKGGFLPTPWWAGGGQR